MPRWPPSCRAADAAQLRHEKELVIVEGAGHLFEESGTMEEVIRHATRWFGTFLPVARPARARARA